MFNKNKFMQFLTLLFALTYRNITARYRKSLLGPLWAIIQPLVYMGLFIFLRKFSNFSNDDIPYPVFTFAALVPWTFFTNAVLQASPSILLNSTIIKKISIPREVFPLSAVTTASFDFIISSFLLFILLFWFNIIPSLTLLWLPLLFFLTAAFAFAVGMLFAALGTFKRDLVMAAPILMQFGLFLSPIMYPLKQVPDQWHNLYMLNPFVGLIESYRNVLLKSVPPPTYQLLYSSVIILLILLIIWPCYRVISQYFADTV